MDITKSHEPDWTCLVASGVIEGPVKNARRKPITWARVEDFLSGFGLGLFVGAFGIFLLLGQLYQWAE